MRSILSIILLMLSLFLTINVTSAAQDLPFERIISVHEWGMQFSTKEKIDQVIKDVIYMNGDAIAMYVGSEYFEAVRDPTKASWDGRASWNMLEYAINKAHENNIQVHVAIPVNSIIPARAEYRLWGTKYNIMTMNGGRHDVRLDPSYSVVQDYEVGLLSFIASRYPTLDGINIEEPFYTTQSYSPPIVARVKAKYNGYDITGKTDSAKIECRGSSLKGLDPSICPTFSKIYDVERDVFNELFTKIRAGVNAKKSNPNLLLSADAFNYYRPLHGFDPVYMSDNNLLDWYIATANTLSLSTFKSVTERMNREINIPAIPVAFITWTTINPIANQEVLNQIAKSCEYGGDAEGLFAYAWRNKIVNGKTVYEGLHNLPVSSLCGPSKTPSTIVSPPTFSPSPGTYSNSKNIVISTGTAGATIRYTTDGTTPSETSRIYTSAIPISSTTTLKAGAWKTGFTPSTITTATYSINTPVPVVSSITVSPASVTTEINSAQTFTADTKDQFGDPIATTLTWTSSDRSVGTITPSGYFTAIAEGTTTITASSGSVIGQVSAVVTASRNNLNIIDNPGFESGTASWNLFTDGIGSFGVTSPGYEGNNAAILALNNIGSNTQLYKTGISLESNTKYRLSFAAYSNTGNDLMVRLFRHSSPYSSYMPDYKANLGTTWQTFTTEFDTTGLTSDVTDGRLMFWFPPFAEAGDKYYIDDIRLEKLPPPNVPLNAAPIILTQPESQTVLVGETATFSIIANDIEALSYQWQKNGVDIPGETDASYTIPATTLQDNGSTYRVILTNPGGTVISEDATLSLVSLPNLITNAGFESGTTSWNFFTDGTGSFRVTSPGIEGNNAAKLTLNNIGSNTQLYKTGISLEPDTNYILSFSAYSNTGNDLMVRFIQHYSPYSPYMPEYTANLGTSWQDYTIEFNTADLADTVNDGRLMFWFSPFAKAGDSYYIDNVRLVKDVLQ